MKIIDVYLEAWKFEIEGLNGCLLYNPVFLFIVWNDVQSFSQLHLLSGCPRGVMVKAMDCGIVVCEFILQSRYYVHFWTNTLGKGKNPVILPAMR